MRFAVLDSDPQDIKDPITGELLGQVARPKVRVAVVQVEPRLSVARTYERVGGRPGLSTIVNLDRALYGTPSVPVTLRTTEETFEELDEESSYVKTGDPVQQIAETIPAEPKP